MVDGVRLRIVVLGHALLEGFDALRHVAHQIGNLAAPEKHHDEQEHDDPMPNRETTHIGLQNPRLSPVTPAAARTIANRPLAFNRRALAAFRETKHVTFIEAYADIRSRREPVAGARLGEEIGLKPLHRHFE